MGNCSPPIARQINGYIEKAYPAIGDFAGLVIGG
jgi:hypothetical protein